MNPPHPTDWLKGTSMIYRKPRCSHSFHPPNCGFLVDVPVRKKIHQTVTKPPASIAPPRGQVQEERQLDLFLASGPRGYTDAADAPGRSGAITAKACRNDGDVGAKAGEKLPRDIKRYYQHHCTTHFGWLLDGK